MKGVEASSTSLPPGLARLGSSPWVSSAHPASTTSRSRSVGELPAIENLYTPRVGWWEHKYGIFASIADDSSRHWSDRAGGVAGGLLTGIPAMADALISAAWNAPNKAAISGQKAAQAMELDGPDATIAGLESALAFLQAFQGFGDVATLGQVGTYSRSLAVSSASSVPIGEIAGVPNSGKTVTLYRVDDAGYAPRIAADGSVPVVATKAGNERALFVNIGQPERAKEFALVNRGGNATVTAVEVDASLLERLRATSIYDRSPDVGLYPNAPLRVDINKAPDQFGLRTPEHFDWLREAVKPNTVRVIDPKDL